MPEQLFTAIMFLLPNEKCELQRRSDGEHMVLRVAASSHRMPGGCFTTHTQLLSVSQEGAALGKGKHFDYIV